MDSHAPFAIKTVPSFSSFATKQPFLVSALKDIHYQIATRNVCYSLKYHLNWLPKSFFFFHKHSKLFLSHFNLLFFPKFSSNRIFVFVLSKKKKEWEILLGIRLLQKTTKEQKGKKNLSMSDMSKRSVEGGEKKKICTQLLLQHR